MDPRSERPCSHGTIGTMTELGVRLVARRHVDYKRVCSACCLPDRLR
ncbi:Ms4527A family Cys-rich leader peptide [Nocardia aurantia]